MRRQKARRPWEEDGDYHSRQTCRRVRIVHHYKQEMSISPHALETLVHQHILFRDFLCRALASVVFADHEEWLDLRKEEEKTAIGFLAGGKEYRNSCGWRCVRGRSHRLVFEDMKRRDGRLGTRKRQPQLIGGEAPLH